MRLINTNGCTLLVEWSQMRLLNKGFRFPSREKYYWAFL
uniref:SFRICE_006358 n=1 Tax=Spodoptera frugiperda TaxID=7108 RepID=A0A2H1VAG9_SPOFR